MSLLPPPLHRPLYLLKALKAYLRHTYPDLLTASLLLIATGALYIFSPVYRYEDLIFPMHKDPVSDTWIAPVDISWPEQEFIVPIWLVTMLAPVVGVGGIVAVGGVWGGGGGKEEGVGRGLMGLVQGFVVVWVAFFARVLFLFAVAAMGGAGAVERDALANVVKYRTFIQVVFKTFVGKNFQASTFSSEDHFHQADSYQGELRPYFMSVCNPNATDFTPDGEHPWLRFPNITQCPAWNQSCIHGSLFQQSKQCKDWSFAVQSFPSGHTSEAVFVAVYLALYLAAKLHAFSDVATRSWKVLVILSPMMGAALVGMAVAMDHHHHVHDVVWSVVIGVGPAFLVYWAHNPAYR